MQDPNITSQIHQVRISKHNLYFVKLVFLNYIFLNIKFLSKANGRKKDDLLQYQR